MRSATVVLACVLPAIFVWLTSAGLPPVVASHFSAGGEANGFMARGSYVAFMTGVTILVPLLIAGSGRLVEVLPERLINLPNPDHWLAPRHRARTLAFLRTMFACFAAAMAVFLCFVHWLVVRAQASRPPRLEQAPLYAAMAVLGLALAAWMVAFIARFRRPG